MQWNVALGNRFEWSVQSEDNRVDQPVAEPERRRGKRVDNRRIHTRLVPVIVPQQSHSVRAEDFRKPFGVRDMLHRRPDNLPSLVIDLVSVPVRVQSAKFGSHSVVFAHPQGMHGQQSQLLVRPEIPGQEARNGTVVRLQALDRSVAVEW